MQKPHYSQIWRNLFNRQTAGSTEDVYSWYVHLPIVLSPLKTRLFKQPQIINICIFLLKIKGGGGGNKFIETPHGDSKTTSIKQNLFDINEKKKNQKIIFWCNSKYLQGFCQVKG